MHLVFCDDHYPARSSFRILEGDWLRARYGAAHLSCPDEGELPKYDLALTVGLNQASSWLDAFERCRVPFVFELYPGFGFSLTSRESYVLLTRVAESPCFRGLMTNMPAGRAYAIDLGVQERRVHFCYGGFVDARVAELEPADAPTVYFCAQNYDGVGYAKGMDVFCLLASLFPSTRFVAFGDWQPTCGVRAPSNLELRGTVPHAELLATYRHGDVFVSPNRMGRNGEWDGFPTCAAVEAGLAGACLLLSDPLGNNVRLRSGHEFLCITEDTVHAALDAVLANREQRLAIGALGRAKLREVYALPVQHAAREKMIEEAMR